jgi:Family of unknown function (DUF5709)
MPDDAPHEYESTNVDDLEVRDAYDTLDGNPGDDPLDRGVITPERWSDAIRFGTTAEEEEQGESLDQLLAEEEPDPALELDDDLYDEDEAAAEDTTGDDDAGDEDVDGLLLDEPSPRAGRLVQEDEGAHVSAEADLVASDVGIDGGAATAEEAAVHVVDDDDYDIPSDS